MYITADIWVQVISKEKLSHNIQVSDSQAPMGWKPTGEKKPKKKTKPLTPALQIWVNLLRRHTINTHCSDYMLLKLNGQVGPRIPLHTVAKMWVSTSSPAAFPLLASEFPSQNNESEFSFSFHSTRTCSENWHYYGGHCGALRPQVAMQGVI